jgi:murein DD-endopeptidase MepM/ murein hydrolase activator NlpD
MKRASLAAAFAASVIMASASAGRAADDKSLDEAQWAEQRLLGSDDEETRFAEYQLFTRQIAAAGTIGASLDASLAGAGVAAATMLDARQALAAAIDLQRDLRPDDRFYVRYEQTFTAEGAPVGIGRVLWVELRTKAKGTIAIYHFQTRDKVDRFWFANGQAATPLSMRLPLDVISVSSGFGLRADPFDQPPPLAAIGKQAPMGGPPKRNALPPGLPTGGTSGNGSTINVATALGASVGLAPSPLAWRGLPRPTTSGSSGSGSGVGRALFMHEGVDLVAPLGTPIYAAADGIVVGAAPNGRYGNWVRIEHSGKLATVYGHLMAFAPGIEPGEAVVRGELIGFVGSTGRSTGAHLHFELQVDGKAVNPITHPELKATQLRGPDLERFKKQIAAALAEREREEKVATFGL